MLINLRNALMAGKRKPTAKDYVQSGLVAMWDGIENAGWGVHDASATTWKDLSGNDNNLSAVGNVAWSDNAAVFDGTSLFERNAVLSNVVVAEVVFKMSTVEFMILIQNGSSGLIGLNQNLVTLAATPGGQGGAAYHRNCFPAILDADTHTCMANYSNWSFWRDGVQQTSIGTNANGATGTRFTVGARIFNNTYGGYMNGNIHCIRLYNRALTADEIAANYAIDKARFNLP